jgi:hypothetical protein
MALAAICPMNSRRSVRMVTSDEVPMTSFGEASR